MYVWMHPACVHPQQLHTIQSGHSPFVQVHERTITLTFHPKRQNEHNLRGTERTWHPKHRGQTPKKWFPTIFENTNNKIRRSKQPNWVSWCHASTCLSLSSMCCKTFWFNEQREQNLQIQWNVAHDCPYCVNLGLKFNIMCNGSIFRTNSRMPEGLVCSLLSNIRWKQRWKQGKQTSRSCYVGTFFCFHWRWFLRLMSMGGYPPDEAGWQFFKWFWWLKSGKVAVRLHLFCCPKHLFGGKG